MLGNLLDNAGQMGGLGRALVRAMEEGDAAQPPPWWCCRLKTMGRAWRATSCRPQASGLRFDDFRCRARGWGRIATQMVQAYGGDLSLGKSALLKRLSVRVVLPGVQAAQRPRKA